MSLRDLREQAFKAWAERGEATNWPLVAEMVRLRIERAQLLGFDTFAAFKLENEMAKDPDGVRQLLTALRGQETSHPDDDTEKLVEVIDRFGGAAGALLVDLVVLTGSTGADLLGVVHTLGDVG